MIKVGYLVSYDYDMIFDSMRLLYDHADEIYLAIDKNRLTWTGNPFEIPQSFFDELRQFDTNNKIQLYFDEFYKSELTPIECDTRERNMLSKKMGKGWLMQVDVDEYIYNFEAIANYLKRYWYLLLFPKLTPIVLKAKWITLFKQTEDGFLYVDNNETFPLITNVANYQCCRENQSLVNHQTDLQVIHQSWARTEEEMLTKFNNWSHRDDFDTMQYFEFWKNLDSKNYKNHKNIHPLLPELWDELNFLESNNLDEFLTSYSKGIKQNLLSIPGKKIFKSFFKKGKKKKNYPV